MVEDLHNLSPINILFNKGNVSFKTLRISGLEMYNPNIFHVILLNVNVNYFNYILIILKSICDNMLGIME